MATWTWAQIRFYLKTNEQNHVHTKEELKVLESTIEFVGFHFQGVISFIIRFTLHFKLFLTAKYHKQSPAPLHVMKTWSWWILYTSQLLGNTIMFLSLICLLPSKKLSNEFNSIIGIELRWKITPFKWIIWCNSLQRQNYFWEPVDNLNVKLVKLKLRCYLIGKIKSYRSVG